MIDKVQKIREGVERLKSNLIRGACASQIAMETRCKEEAYNEVLAILDTLQEEPVSEEWIEELSTKLYSLSKEDFEKVMAKYSKYGGEEPVSEFLNTESMIESYKQRLISQANGVKNSPLINMCLASYKHGINEILDTLNLSNVQRTIKSCKEEPVSEDLEKAYTEYANERLKLVRQDISDSSYIRDRKMSMDIFDGYQIEDAFEAGANWQREQMMAKAIDAHCFGFQGAALFSFRLPADKYLVGSEVKVIVIKED